jgi:hypothetical protein
MSIKGKTKNLSTGGLHLMLRDQLLKQLSALPSDAVIGVQIGNEHLDVTDVTPWGDEGFVDLQCDPADLRDVLMEWGLPAHKRQQLVATDSALRTPGEFN